MLGKVIVLSVALFVCSVAGETKQTHLLQRLLAGRKQPPPQAPPARMERRVHLSEDEREIMTKQIMQAISEMMNSECMSDRDYQGWVDFGRRDTE